MAGLPAGILTLLPNLDRARFMLTCLLSARYGRMNRHMIGHTLELTSEEISHQMVTAYAAATNDDNPRYQRKNAATPPLLISRLVLPLIKQLIVLPDLKMNVLRMVHAEQELRWHVPIRIGDRIRVILRIGEIVDTSAGELLELRGQAFCDDQLLGDAVASMLVRGKKRASRESSPSEPQQPSEPVQRQETFRIPMVTSKDQAMRYAEASGDDNFIHTNELLARLGGLPGTILQGMCVLAMSCAAITNEQLEGDIGRLAGLRARFSRPALPGQTLTVVGYDQGKANCIGFEVQGPAGERVIKQGEVALA